MKKYISQSPLRLLLGAGQGGKAGGIERWQSRYRPPIKQLNEYTYYLYIGT